MDSPSPNELHQFLTSRGVEHLYFSCTVRNACSMLNFGEIMSFGQLLFKKLPMSEMDNVAKYKNACMWNKISLYLHKLHGYFPRQNWFGPVCFKISTDFLLEMDGKDLRVSKYNLLNRKRKYKMKDACYSSIDEFSEAFDSLFDEKKIHKNIILVRDKKSHIYLRKYLKEITLDNLDERHLLLKKAENALADALKNSELNDVPLKVTKCEKFCFCQINYNEMTTDEIEKLFLP